METKMSTEEIVEWCRKFVPDMTEEECLEAYKIYRSYYDEGQSSLVSRQYAGLI